MKSAGGWGATVITGASRGIGEALARELAPRVASLHLIARDEAKLGDVANEVARTGTRVTTHPCDVRDTASLVSLMRRLDSANGGIDLVIANAGVGASAPHTPSYAWEVIRDAITTNLVGAVATLTANLPAMVSRGRGHLVGIGSIASYGALPDSLAYCAPKAGLKMALDCLRLDTAATGVHVTHVRLGFVETDMVKKSTHPMPQLTSPEFAARSVVNRLTERPREVVYPRALAALARGLTLLPESLRETIAQRSRGRV